MIIRQLFVPLVLGASITIAQAQEATSTSGTAVVRPDVAASDRDFLAKQSAAPPSEALAPIAEGPSETTRKRASVKAQSDASAEAETKIESELRSPSPAQSTTVATRTEPKVRAEVKTRKSPQTVTTAPVRVATQRETTTRTRQAVRREIPNEYTVVEGPYAPPVIRYVPSDEMVDDSVDISEDEYIRPSRRVIRVERGYRTYDRDRHFKGPVSRFFDRVFDGD
jgi:hypothetical protein